MWFLLLAWLFVGIVNSRFMTAFLPPFGFSFWIFGVFCPLVPTSFIFACTFCTTVQAQNFPWWDCSPSNN